MKFLHVLFSMLLILPLPCFALDEVLLEVDDNNAIDTYENLDTTKLDDEVSLYEKIKEIRENDVKDIQSSSYLLEEMLTQKYRSGPIESLHFFSYYRGFIGSDLSNGMDSDYDFNAVHAGVNGKFRNSKTYYEARLRFDQRGGISFWERLPADIYIANASIPHHKIIIGNTRTPTGVEGARSDSIIPFAARAQISRNFGDVRKLGIRVKGKYDLVEYDIGGYSSGSYFVSDFFPGTEFSGWLTLKPLGKLKDKYGKLRFGSGVTAGNNHTDYKVFGLYAEYEYKRLMANIEYAYADGYNGARKVSTNTAEGLYTTLGYKISPKAQIVVRYDQFNPNKDIANNMSREYSAGINYFIKGQALKLMLNYVYCDNDARENSHRIILGTQILI